ncbi:hypothetical protein [Cohnella faecalis]|uniref:hypothetical protein n=1 Tax=Cohnella faecalis TaxID=2315694 RepID=UPI0011C2108C|nr:hypothetical protein [Cohnella faecalis]
MLFQPLRQIVQLSVFSDAGFQNIVDIPRSSRTGDNAGISNENRSCSETRGTLPQEGHPFRVEDQIGIMPLRFLTNFLHHPKPGIDGFIRLSAAFGPPIREEIPRLGIQPDASIPTDPA